MKCSSTQNPLIQTQLLSLMEISNGRPHVTIGIIDGPVDLTHPAFSKSNIRTTRTHQYNVCKNAGSTACMHGTFVTGILCAKRGLSAPAICPGCQIILHPIFKEENKCSATNCRSFPVATPKELANAIIETVDAGAKIINLSLGLSSSSLAVYQSIQNAYDYALMKNVVIVVAAGNQTDIGSISLINHQWPIPVTLCDENGHVTPLSPFGPSIGNRGIMAPGENIISTYPRERYGYMSGTSFAVPFVTGTLALLLSIFPKATSAQLIYVMRLCFSRRHAIIPKLLNAKVAYDTLLAIFESSESR